MNILYNQLKSTFSQIPNELIVDMSVSAGALRVLLYLFTKGDSWHIRNSEICEKLQVSEKTLSKYWKELLASRWLRRESALKGGFCYYLGDFSITTGESVQDAKDLNNKKKPLKKEEVLEAPFYLKEAWSDWISYRKQRRLTCTAQTLQTQLKNLIKWHQLGHNSTEIIINSISQGYQGLFEPRKKAVNGDKSKWTNNSFGEINLSFSNGSEFLNKNGES